MANSSLLGSLSFSLILILVAFCSTATHSAAVQGFSIREATVHDLQLAFKQNQLTSRRLVEFYIGEIHRLNPVVNGVIEINPDALLQADKADRELEANKPGSLCGGLHGIPVLLKDTIGTKDKLNTTAGSFALLGSIVPRDAGVVKRLRRAGAIILGKASLSEWANVRSLTAPAGLSARGGQGKVFASNKVQRQFHFSTFNVFSSNDHLFCTILFRIHMFYQHHPVDPAVDLPYQLQQT